MKNNFSIIIQGPLNENSISNIDIYKKYGEVIFVSWAQEFEQSIQLIQKIKDNNIFLLLLPHPRFTENSQNIALQVNSVLSGLKIANNDYVIKLRSDEKYSNLDALIEKLENSNKIITSNIFFRKYRVYPWHISDHIIAGHKIKLLPIFQNCAEFCLNKRQWYLKNKNILNVNRHLVAEQIITLCSIPVLNNTEQVVLWDNEDYCKSFMKNNFDIINVNELGEFIVSYTINGKRNYRNKIKDFINPNTDIVYSMNEYI